MNETLIAQLRVLTNELNIIGSDRIRNCKIDPNVKLRNVGRKNFSTNDIQSDNFRKHTRLVVTINILV